MIYLKLGLNEPFEFLLRKFKRLYEKSGILSEIKKHEFYEKPATIRKKAKAAAIRRKQKNLLYKKNIKS